MTDEQIETLLRRYQPQRPPAELRARVLTAASGAARVPLTLLDWALLVAAACLVAAAVWPTVDKRSDDPLTAAYRDRVQEVAERLGGSAEAEQLAVIVVAAQPRADDRKNDEPEKEIR